MKERPILFSGSMVRAILAGHKTVTRRVVTAPRWAEPGTLEFGDDGSAEAIARASGCLADVSCPYGVAGDRLWVRETWRADDYAPAETIYQADCPPDAAKETRGVILWRPSIFIPRERSRLTLNVVSARVERLHAIDDADAVREGVLHGPSRFDGTKHPPPPNARFAMLWESINAKRAPWNSNPWVWRVEFARTEPAR